MALALTGTKPVSYTHLLFATEFVMIEKSETFSAISSHVLYIISLQIIYGAVSYTHLCLAGNAAHVLAALYQALVDTAGDQAIGPA